MTGFGQASADFEGKTISVQIKSLNSKQLDLSTKIASRYRDRDILIRSLCSPILQRGKVELSLTIEETGGSSSNKSIFDIQSMKLYREAVIEFCKELHIEEPSNWAELLIRMPNSLVNSDEELNEDISDAEWLSVTSVIEEALENYNSFRFQEGAMMADVFEEKIAEIANLLEELEQYEESRVVKIKERIEENLQKIPQVQIDRNRFEQELIYYIEKLDINEEKSRLRNHLNYFIETLHADAGQGKKLGFIVQEIGREINTLGSKSNQVDMQQCVVKMKDELEQIKEQILNVL